MTIDLTSEPKQPISFKLAEQTVREGLKNTKIDMKLIGELIYQLDEKQYEEKPVDIETFIYHPRYLGNIFGQTIYPFWVDLLKKVYPTPFFAPYNEVVVSAALGVGKSTVSTIGMLYDIYKLLCLKNPQLYFGLAPDTKIVFMFFSATKNLAQGVNFEVVEKCFINSPFFQENVKMPSGKNSIFDKGIELSKRIIIEIGSKIRHALGKAVFGAVLDEANFQNQNTNQAKETYEGIINRLGSRFDGAMGLLPGTLYIMSSPKSSGSFVDELMQKLKTSKTALIVNNIPVWEVKKGRDKYSGEKFKVFLGNDTIDPFIVEGIELLKVTSEMESSIIEVPIEFYDRFNTNLSLALNDIAGRTTGSILSLFKDKQKLTDIMVIPNESRFTKPVISLSKKDNIEIMNYMQMDYFRNIYKPNCYRFVHIDLGVKGSTEKNTGDFTGISSVFAEPFLNLDSDEYSEYTQEEKELIMNQSEYNTKLKDRFYYVDFILTIEKGNSDEIPIYKIVKFIKFLQDIKYPIKIVTCDSFQGIALRQELERNNIPTEYLSVSTRRNKQGRYNFYNFKDYVDRKRIISVNHPIAFKELTELLDDGVTVEHPQISLKGGKGHDDTAQSLVGAFTSCYHSKVIQSTVSIMKQYFEKKQIESTNDISQLKNLAKSQKLKEATRKIYIKKFF